MARCAKRHCLCQAFRLDTFLHHRGFVDMDAEAGRVVESGRRRAGKHDIGGALCDTFRQAMNPKAGITDGCGVAGESDEGIAGGEGGLGLGDV